MAAKRVHQKLVRYPVSTNVPADVRFATAGTDAEAEIEQLQSEGYRIVSTPAMSNDGAGRLIALVVMEKELDDDERQLVAE